MDDQATKLRQLVRSVRHAASLATGPPLMLVFAPSGEELATELYQALSDACVARGIHASAVANDGRTPTGVDWMLAQASGEYRVDEHEVWHRASALLVVTDDSDESIVECYQQLKSASQHTPLPPLELLVMGDSGGKASQAAADRLLQTCQRFLLCSIAGTTLLDVTKSLSSDSIAALVDRLAMMAPVATPVLNSPLVTHDV